VITNARVFAKTLMARGYKIVSDGTDNHLFLVKLIDKNITGKDAEALLGKAHMTLNKNAVPNDPKSPFITSGLRIGTPAATTRGFKEPEIVQVANWVADILDKPEDEAQLEKIRLQVLQLCKQFPVYQ
jgi:glycine hydroxymethyltransferase